MPIVKLGNTAPIETVRGDDSTDEVTERRPLDVEDAVTTFQVPDGTALGEAILTITRAFDGYHSDAPPAWVESSDPLIAAAVAQHYESEDHTVEVKAAKRGKK